MRVASLDLGSNTTLMLIAEVNAGGLEVLKDESTVTRMGQEISQTGRLHEEALKRLDRCLRSYRELIDQFGVDKVVAVATSAARDAENSSDLQDIVDRYEIPVKIISGDQEALVTHRGSTFDQPNPKQCLVIDIGGGSTELVSLDSSGKAAGKSLDIGSVRIIDMFIQQHPVPDAQFEAASQYIDQVILSSSELKSISSGKQAVAVAGTPTTLSMLLQEIEFSEERVHGHEITRSQVSGFLYRVKEMSVEERRGLKGMPPKRADVIVAGLLILDRVMDNLGFEKILVSTKGVRYGLALEALEQNGG